MFGSNRVELSFKDVYFGIIKERKLSIYYEGVCLSKGVGVELYYRSLWSNVYSVGWNKGSMIFTLLF